MSPRPRKEGSLLVRRALFGDACASRFGRDRVEFVERDPGSLLTLAKPTDRLFRRHLLPLPFIQTTRGDDGASAEVNNQRWIGV